MPHIVFTAHELVDGVVADMRAASAEILRLSDLASAPLDPGESPDARRHKIAKLGKRLAERFEAFDRVMNTLAERADEALDLATPPPKPPDAESN